MVRSSKLKSIHKAERHALRHHAEHWLLSAPLEEALFHHADVLSEGGVRAGTQGLSTYFGSTMLSIELSQLGLYARGLSGVALRDALLRAIDGSVRVRLRAMRLARAEASRRVLRRTLGTALCEVRVSFHGIHLHIDVDLEVPLRVSSRATRPG